MALSLSFFRKSILGSPRSHRFHLLQEMQASSALEVDLRHHPAACCAGTSPSHPVSFLCSSPSLTSCEIHGAGCLPKAGPCDHKWHRSPCRHSSCGHICGIAGTLGNMLIRCAYDIVGGGGRYLHPLQHGLRYLQETVCPQCIPSSIRPNDTFTPMCLIAAMCRILWAHHG